MNLWSWSLGIWVVGIILVWRGFSSPKGISWIGWVLVAFGLVGQFWSI